MNHCTEKSDADFFSNLWVLVFFLFFSFPDAVLPSKAVNSVLRGTKLSLLTVTFRLWLVNKRGGKGTRSEEQLRARLCENHKMVLGGLQ